MNTKQDKERAASQHAALQAEVAAYRELHDFLSDMIEAGQEIDNALISIKLANIPTGYSNKGE